MTDRVLSRSSFFVPEDRVEVVKGTLLAWTAASDTAGITHHGGADLLPAFLNLESAEPDEMARFMETYGVPELCVHGQPDHHRDIPRPELGMPSRPDHDQDHRPVGTTCEIGVLEDGRPAIAVADLRRAARAMNAAHTASIALAARRLPEPNAWEQMARLQVGHPARDGVETWHDGRTELASWVTGLLTNCGVSAVADWSGPRLRVEPEADGLLGTIALLLAREVGQGDRYVCDVCGEPVDRVRAPQPGELVYCRKPACRREQQRRNQQRWRARKRAAQQEG